MWDLRPAYVKSLFPYGSVFYSNLCYLCLWTANVIHIFKFCFWIYLKSLQVCWGVPKERETGEKAERKRKGREEKRNGRDGEIEFMGRFYFKVGFPGGEAGGFWINWPWPLGAACLSRLSSLPCSCLFSLPTVSQHLAAEAVSSAMLTYSSKCCWQLLPLDYQLHFFYSRNISYMPKDQSIVHTIQMTKGALGWRRKETCCVRTFSSTSDGKISLFSFFGLGLKLFIRPHTPGPATRARASPDATRAVSSPASGSPVCCPCHIYTVTACRWGFHVCTTRSMPVSCLWVHLPGL